MKDILDNIQLYSKRKQTIILRDILKDKNQYTEYIKNCNPFQLQLLLQRMPKNESMYRDIYDCLIHNYFVIDKKYIDAVEQFKDFGYLSRWEYCLSTIIINYMIQYVVSPTQFEDLTLIILKKYLYLITDLPPYIHKVLKFDNYKRNFNILYQIVKDCELNKQEEELHLNQLLKVCNYKTTNEYLVNCVLTLHIPEEYKQKFNSVAILKKL